MTALRRPREQPGHQVDPGHPLAQRRAEQPGGPQDRLAVGVDEVTGLDDRAHGRVGVRLHDLGHVDHDVLVDAPAGDEAIDGVERLVHGQVVDGHAEQVDAPPRTSGWIGVGGDHGRYRSLRPGRPGRSARMGPEHRRRYPLIRRHMTALRMSLMSVDATDRVRPVHRRLDAPLRGRLAGRWSRAGVDVVRRRRDLRHRLGDAAVDVRPVPAAARRMRLRTEIFDVVRAAVLLGPRHVRPAVRGQAARRQPPVPAHAVRAAGRADRGHADSSSGRCCGERRARGLQHPLHDHRRHRRKVARSFATRHRAPPRARDPGASATSRPARGGPCRRWSAVGRCSGTSTTSRTSCTTRSSTRSAVCLRRTS